MSQTCDVCKNPSVVKDPVLCNVCKVTAAHPSCAVKQSKRAGLPLQPIHLWVCRPCRAETNSTGSGADLQGAAGSGDQFATLQANILAAFDEKFQILDAVNQRLTDIETSLNFLSNKYDDMFAQFTEQKAHVVALREGLESVHQKLKVRDNTVSELQLRVDQLEQAGLSLNLELHGVPEVPQIPLATQLQELAAKVGAPPPNQTVADMFRLPSRPPKTQGQRHLPGVVVLKFKEASARDAWLKGRNNLLPARPPRPGGEAGAAPPATAAEAVAGPQQRPPAPVRVYEQLTPRNKRLLFIARQAGEKKGFKFVWVRGGKLFARKDQGEALVRIQTEDDVRKKMGFVLPVEHNATQ